MGKKRFRKVDEISTELKKYGYVHSAKKSFLLFSIGTIVSLVIGRLFKLNAACQMIFLVWVAVLLPFFMINSVKARYHEKRFSDANVYIEQFLYSFLKTRNILATLKDVKQLFEDRSPMGNNLGQVMEYIQYQYDDESVETNGLRILEEAYPTPLIKTIHGFALQVEKNGGECSDSIMLLLEARRFWATRNCEFMAEKRKQFRNVVLSIVTSLLLCILMFNLTASSDVALWKIPIVNIVTVFVLMLDFLIFYRAYKSLSVDYLKEKPVDYDEILKTYNRIDKYDENSILDTIGKKVAIKRITRAVEKEYPSWLMQVALLLQHENVQMAILKSYDDAPLTLKPKIKELLDELREKPESMEPYLNFMKEYPLPQIQSSMKMLYSVSEGTGADADQEINEMIKQDLIMFDKAQELKNQDALAGMYALFLIPQLTGGLKLTVDMMMTLFAYLGNMNGL